MTLLGLWADALASGVTDAVFWASTPREVGALLHAVADRDEAKERAATLRAGLVASAVYNVHRKKGKPPIQPSDFLKPEVEVLEPDEFRDVMLGWARGHKGDIEA